MSDPELVGSHPRKRDSFPILTDFPQPIEQWRTQNSGAPVDNAATIIGLGIEDELTVPDVVTGKLPSGRGDRIASRFGDSRAPALHHSRRLTQTQTTHARRPARVRQNG